MQHSHSIRLLCLVFMNNLQPNSVSINIMEKIIIILKKRRDTEMKVLVVDYR